MCNYLDNMSPPLEWENQANRFSVLLLLTLAAGARWMGKNVPRDEAEEMSQKLNPGLR